MFVDISVVEMQEVFRSSLSRSHDWALDVMEAGNIAALVDTVDSSLGFRQFSHEPPDPGDEVWVGPGGVHGTRLDEGVGGPS